MSEKAVAEAKKVINPFAKFNVAGTRKAYIKSLDYEIEYRPLTMEDDDEYSLRLVVENADGSRSMNYEEATDIKYEKVSKVLVDPPMTVEQLRVLSSDADAVMVEILKLIEPKVPVDDQGNSKTSRKRKGRNTK